MLSSGGKTFTLDWSNPPEKARIVSTLQPLRREPPGAPRRDALMPETRRRFHKGLRDVEARILGMGEAARKLFERSLRALNDPPLSDAVIAGDDEVDAYCAGIEEQFLELLALQTPVACDLRLLTVLLHMS